MSMYLGCDCWITRSPLDSSRFITHLMPCMRGRHGASIRQARVKMQRVTGAAQAQSTVKVQNTPQTLCTCNCGSIKSGQRAVVVTMTPFSMLSPSDGKPSVAH